MKRKKQNKNRGKPEMTYDWINHEPIEDYIHELAELKKEIYLMQTEIENLKHLVTFWKGKAKGLPPKT